MNRIAGSCWIIIGGIAGAIAKLLMPGKDPGGCIVTILLGIAGALLAGFLGQSLGWYEHGEWRRLHRRRSSAPSCILFIYRLILRRR